MTVAKKTGNEMQVYRNNGGSFAVPTPVILPTKDVHLMDQPGGVIDGSDRSVNVDMFYATRRKWTVEFGFLWDFAEAGLVLLVAAARDGSAIHLVITDTAIATSGARGLNAWWLVESGWDNDAKLRDGQDCKVKLVPHANRANDPVVWLTA